MQQIPSMSTLSKPKMMSVSNPNFKINSNNYNPKKNRVGRREYHLPQLKWPEYSTLLSLVAKDKTMGRRSDCISAFSVRMRCSLFKQAKRFQMLLRRML